MSPAEYLDKLEVKVDPRAVMYVQGYNDKKKLQPAMLELISREIEEATGLARPQAIYQEFVINKMQDDFLMLEDDIRLSTGKRITNLWEGGERLGVALCTIGGGLEARVSELSQKGENMAAFTLDIAGTVALGSVIEQVQSHICRKAADNGVTVGPWLNPGYGEWPLTDQRLIFRVMPAASIGVTLNDQCMMIPKKSTTLCAGVGVIESGEHFNRCQHCGVAKCPYRRHGKNRVGGLDDSDQYML